MSKPFDAVVKGMLEESPVDWPILAGFKANQVEVIDADVSTYTGAADKVLRVAGQPDWIMHIEFQTGPDRSLPHRLHVYNALLEDRHQLLVRSVLVLLRPQADHSNLTGLYERGFPQEPPYLAFRYHVVRVWQLPVEPILMGGLGTLSLAPIAAVITAEVPGIVQRMKGRLRASRTHADRCWAATYVLMGLRYEQAVVDKLLQGVIAMEESTTYQAIIAKGRAEGVEQGAILEARKTLLRLGQELFGAPEPEIRTRIERMNDLAQLEELSLRLLRVSSWQELLEAKGARRRKKRS